MNLTGIVVKTIQPFIVGPSIIHEPINFQGVDTGVWFNGSAYLLLVANLNSSSIFMPWGALGIDKLTSNSTDQLQRIFSVAQNTNVSGLNFRPGGIGIYTATPPQ